MEADLAHACSHFLVNSWYHSAQFRASLHGVVSDIASILLSCYMFVSFWQDLNIFMICKDFSVFTACVDTVYLA